MCGFKTLTGKKLNISCDWRDLHVEGAIINLEHKDE
jgi:hypothetical protein